MDSVECTIVERRENGSLEVAFDTSDEPATIGKKKVHPLQREDKARLQPGARLRVTLGKDGAVSAIETIVDDASAEVAAQAEQHKQQRQDHQAQRKQHRQTATAVTQAVGVEQTPERAPEQRTANPYTFLPFAKPAPTARERRPRHRTAPWPDEDESLLSGSVTVELALRSPLCVFGAAEWEDAQHRWDNSARAFRREAADTSNDQRHRRVRAARDRHGQPVVPGSTLKGLMRSWLEVITSSWRLIDESPVAWREISLEPTRPAKIKIRDADGKPVKDLFKRWNAKSKKLSSGITVELEPLTMWTPPASQEVEGFQASQRALTAHWDVPSDGALHDGQPVRSRDGRRQGRLKAAAAMGGRQNPGDASLHVLLEPEHERSAIAVEPEIVERWCLAHEITAESNSRRHEFDKPASARVHHEHGARVQEVTRPKTDVLGDGMLVWYREHRSRRVGWFGRIRNGRWAERAPMLARTPPGHGATSEGTLDVARLLFGTADEGQPQSRPADPDADAASGQADSWAGRIRVGAARWTSQGGEPHYEWLTLKALSSPKLQSAGMYLRADDRRALTWGRDRARRDADETAGQDPPKGEIAGTKVYWHTPPSPNASLASRVKTEQTEIQGVTEAVKTTQNATVEALTTSEGVLRFEVNFEDLRRDELGALLLACSLQFDAQHDGERGWKLGIGKPLGLGSVANRVVGLRLLDLDQRYHEPVEPFAGGHQDPDDHSLIEELQQEARQAYLAHTRRDFVETLEAAARLDSVWAHPVAYPRMKPDFQQTRTPEGLSKQWPGALEVLDGIYHPDDRKRA